MLNENKVLTYIKDNLGFPFQPLEISDEKIMHHVKEYTLNEYSHYFPYEKTTPLSLTSQKVPGKENEWYIEDNEGLEILNVQDIYFSDSNYIIHGHPPYGAFEHGDLKDWALLVETSITTKMFSSFDKTFEFIHPNIVRISPVVNVTDHEVVVIKYETVQPKDFRGIKNEFQTMFCELSLADIMILIGRIRKRYGDGTLRTPFGEIPLSSEILDEGKEKKRDLIEQFKMGSLPNVIIDHG